MELRETVNKHQQGCFTVIEEAARLVEDVSTRHHQLAQTELGHGNQGSQRPQLTAQADHNDVGPGMLGIERAQTGVSPFMPKKRGMKNISKFIPLLLQIQES